MPTDLSIALICHTKRHFKPAVINVMLIDLSLGYSGSCNRLDQNPLKFAVSE